MGEFSWNGHPLDSMLYRLGSGTATREDQSRAYSELKAAIEEVHRLREQLRVARRLLWIRHGCPIAALYGDDGEMQCRNCGIDFKRTEPGEIDRMFKQAGLARIDAIKEPPHV